MIKDIFDIENISDLPESLQLECNKKKTMNNRVYDLFKMKDSLTAIEIIAAMYRKYNVIIRKHYVQIILCQFMKEGSIKKIRNCTYRINEENTNVK